jgi:4-hydroxybenzoate polyprenyltransferase
MMTIAPYFRLIRIENGLIAILTLFAFQIVTFNAISIHLNEAILLLIILLSLSAGNVTNDIQDVEIDRLNHRVKRPLVSGAIGLGSAKKLYVILLSIIFILALSLPLEAQLLILFNNILLYFYSLKLKGKALIGNITVAYLSASIFLLCAIFYNNYSNTLLLSLFAFFIHLIRELAKDLEDIQGDRLKGLHTFPIVFGHIASKRLILFFSYLLSVSIFTINFVKENLLEYNLSMLLFMILPLFVIYIKFVSKENKNNFSSASKYYKLLMLIGLLIIIVFRNDLRFT